MARDRGGDNDFPFTLNAPLALPESAPPPPKKRFTSPVIALIVVMILIVAGLSKWLLGSGGSGADNGTLIDSSGARVAVFTFDGPTLHAVDNPQRPLQPVTTPGGAGGYTFLDNSRWDPCQPIHYVVNGFPPFPKAKDILTAAIAEVSRDTGLKFVNDGHTDEEPTERREAFLPAIYGDKWAPVLIAWTDADTIKALAGSIIGEGGAGPGRVHGEDALVSGILYLDAPQLAESGDTATGRADLRATILHELGHVVGLDHVKDKTSLMYPSIVENGPRDFSTPDLRGLARAGNGPCQPYAAGRG